ncbi:hypothetical protein AAC387_Pa05g2225 [Persea americana]
MDSIYSAVLGIISWSALAMGALPLFVLACLVLERSEAQGIPTHTPDVQCSKGVDNETKVDDSVALSSCTNVGGGIGHKDYVQRKHAEVEMCNHASSRPSVPGSTRGGSKHPMKPTRLRSKTHESEHNHSTSLELQITMLFSRRQLIAKFRRILETRKQKGDAMSEEITDLMDGPMHMRDGEGKLLHKEEVLDNIVSLVIGGNESTALPTMLTSTNSLTFFGALE